jgi:glucose-6-phosphate 1-epimerase
MTDMPPDGWRHMLCVEAASADTPVRLAPGKEWYGRQSLVVA